jgi:transposase-like protein
LVSAVGVSVAQKAYRRFVYPAPNCLWQLDATESVLTGGRKCVIFQLIDDHSHFPVASHAAAGETSEAAITVVKKGITAHGVPQKLLTDYVPRNIIGTQWRRAGRRQRVPPE